MRVVKLGDVIDVQHGWAFKGELFAERRATLPIVLKPGNFRPTGGLDLGYGRTQCYVGDYPPDYELTPGDVLVVMTCQTQGGEILGAPGRVPKDGRTYLHNQRLGKVLVKDEESAELEYVYWLFADERMRQRLTASATGSTVLHTSPSRIGEVEIWLPSTDEQRRIAGVLTALDDKIEHNRLLAATVGDVVGALFSHACLAPSTSGQGTLPSIAAFKNGGAFTKLANGVGRPIIRIKELNDGVGDATLRTDHEVIDEHVARQGDLLFSWSGSLDVYRWHGPDSIINQHIFKVIPRDGYPIWFVEGWLRQHLAEFQAIARDKATTMGHIKRHHLEDAVVVIPDARRLAQLDAVMHPLDELCTSLHRETQRLAAIRGRLLPKLVSGRIRVPEHYNPDDVLARLPSRAKQAEERP